MAMVPVVPGIAMAVVAASKPEAKTDGKARVAPVIRITVAIGVAVVIGGRGIVIWITGVIRVGGIVVRWRGIWRVHGRFRGVLRYRDRSGLR
jgi:hypothetical protein